MIFKENNFFLFHLIADFDKASRMMEDNKGQSILMAPLRFHINQNRVAMDDWESFLYTICDLSGVSLEWFDKSLPDKMMIDKKGTKQLIGDMKANRTRTLVSVLFISLFNKYSIHNLDF